MQHDWTILLLRKDEEKNDNGHPLKHNEIQSINRLMYSNVNWNSQQIWNSSVCGSLKVKRIHDAMLISVDISWYQIAATKCPNSSST